MSDGNKNNLADPDLWIRLIYMIVFGLLSWLARVVILIIAVIQFLLALFSGQGNRNLGSLGDGIAQWTCQTYRFLTFVSEQKPYPFDDWPSTPQIDSAVGVGETRPPVVPEAASAGVREAGDDSPSQAGATHTSSPDDDSQKNV